LNIVALDSFAKGGCKTSRGDALLLQSARVSSFAYVARISTNIFCEKMNV